MNATIPAPAVSAWVLDQTAGKPVLSAGDANARLGVLSAECDYRSSYATDSAAADAMVSAYTDEMNRLQREATATPAGRLVDVQAKLEIALSIAKLHEEDKGTEWELIRSAIRDLDGFDGSTFAQHRPPFVFAIEADPAEALSMLDELRARLDIVQSRVQARAEIAR